MIDNSIKKGARVFVATKTKGIVRGTICSIARQQMETVWLVLDCNKTRSLYFFKDCELIPETQQESIRRIFGDPGGSVSIGEAGAFVNGKKIF